MYYQYSTTNPTVREFAKQHRLSLSESPEELLDLLEKNPEAEEFVQSY